MEPLDRIAETIAAHHVNFVVIENYGAQLHGVEVQTQDADMAFQRERQNLERLMAALAGSPGEGPRQAKGRVDSYRRRQGPEPQSTFPDRHEQGHQVST